MWLLMNLLFRRSLRKTTRRGGNRGHCAADLLFETARPKTHKEIYYLISTGEVHSRLHPRLALASWRVDWMMPAGFARDIFEGRDAILDFSQA
ncbi:hypothetical protein RB213_010087 [Colletotrichum asianum]